MERCPLEYQRRGSPREASPEDRKRLYINKGLIFAIFGVKICRIVIPEVHSNHDPKESGYLWHFVLLILLSSTTLRSEAGRPSGNRTHWPECRGGRFTGVSIACFIPGC